METATETAETTCERHGDDDDDDDGKEHVSPGSDDDDEDDDELSCFADMGFLFEGSQPTQRQTIVLRPPNALWNVRVTVKSIHDDPGALQSGHYLWPAARRLLQFMVDATSTALSLEQEEGAGFVYRLLRRVLLTERPSKEEEEWGLMELGAGCGLVGLGMVQMIHQLRLVNHSRIPPCCMVFTDHDPGTLSLCQENWNLTRERDDISVEDEEEEDDDDDDDDAQGPKDKACYTSKNTVDSTMFVQLRWGDAPDVEDLFRHVKLGRFSLVLGSDLIYCPQVVRPLFQSATWLLKGRRRRPQSRQQTGAFFLSQSFAYDDTTEAEIEAASVEFQLTRLILVDRLEATTKSESASEGEDEGDDGPLKIQVFYLSQLI